jgi:hypothetical protein
MKIGTWNVRSFYRAGSFKVAARELADIAGEKRRLRVLENKVLRRMFGPRRDEVTGEWWRLHNEELNVLQTNQLPLDCFVPKVLV